MNEWNIITYYYITNIGVGAHPVKFYTVPGTSGRMDAALAAGFTGTSGKLPTCGPSLFNAFLFHFTAVRAAPIPADNCTFGSASPMIAAWKRFHIFTWVVLRKAVISLARFAITGRSRSTAGSTPGKREWEEWEEREREREV